MTTTKGFRLPQRTLDELEILVNEGYFKNMTEAVIVAVEHLATEHNIHEKLKEKYRQKD